MHYANCNYIIFHVLYNHSKEQKKQTFGHTETTQYNEDIRKRFDLLKKSSSRKKEKPIGEATNLTRSAPIKRKVAPLYQEQRKKTMKKIKIKNGKLYSSRMPLCEGIDVFEIVEKIPENYFVWNIGENMGTDEYIPLAEDLHPEDKDNYEINRHTLKAIKLNVEEVKLLRRASAVGINSKATAEKALRSKRHGYMSDRKKAEAENTIDVFERISA